MKYTLSADRFRIWLMVIFLAILALASFWTLEILRKQNHASKPAAAGLNEPDYFVEKFNFIRLPNNGQSNYQINGEKLLHYPENENIQIIRPKIHSVNQTELPLYISAETATIEQKMVNFVSLKSKTDDHSRDHDLIHLHGKVIVERSEQSRPEYLRLQSEYFLLRPDDGIMQTDQAVALFSKKTEAQAIGMIANNNTQQIELLHKVQLRFRPAGNSDASSKQQR